MTRAKYSNAKYRVWLTCKHYLIFRIPAPGVGDMLYCRRCCEWRRAERIVNEPVVKRADKTIDIPGQLVLPAVWDVDGLEPL